MAREINLSQINDFFEEDIVDVVAATTLEWTLSSPPPFHQINELPQIK